MAKYIKKLAADLMTRLPELEWKITKLNPALLYKSIPKQVFRTANITALSCIDELKLDIRSLVKQKSDVSSLYLAEQIMRKINILVNLCAIEKKQVQLHERLPLSINTLSTRQQWLHELEQNIAVLSKQQQALIKTLSAMQSHNKDAAVLLNLQAELGSVEKSLTQAKETLNKATNVQII